MTLKDALVTFTKNNPRKHILSKDYNKAFMPIAQAILNGYFEVSKGNTPVKFIRPTKVEFYYHEEYAIPEVPQNESREKEESTIEDIRNEDLDSELTQLYNDTPVDEKLLIKDFIVYHRNTSKDTHVPLFEIGTLNNHQSGIDITFEHEITVDHIQVYVRASALIRGFYVYTSQEECEAGQPIPSKHDSDTSLRYPEDRCTYLYNQLYGESSIFKEGLTIKWIDCERTIEPCQAPRKNVCQYTLTEEENNKNRKIQKTSIPDNREFQYFNPLYYPNDASTRSKK